LHGSDRYIAKLRDPAGREVVLLARVWEDKIPRDHPELASHLAAVLQTIAAPDHLESDPTEGRERYYARGVGPSRWLVVVLSFEQTPARVVTAWASRKDPKQWKP
jgi:hypothetical protein